MRGTVQLVGVISLLVVTGCSSRRAVTAKDGGLDAGAKPTDDAGKTGGKGGSTSGKGGSTGGAGGMKSIADEDGGAGSGTGTSNHGGPASDSGSMDARVPDAGRATPPGPGCAGLMQCCAALPDPDRMNCELIATNADDATCQQFQQVSCASAGADAGALACATLNQCCDSLPRGDVRVACASTVMTGTALSCAQLTGALCPTGGDPNACAALSPCCAGLPPPRRAACDMVVQQGLAAGCAAVLGALCP